MKGYLTTCDGAQFELPTLLKWEFSYTGSVPCDSFTLKCAYEPAMAEVLRRAVRFTAREDGTVEFAGVVDECGVTCDEKGLQLEVSGRGMAALLLDNEAESVSYQWATMEVRVWYAAVLPVWLVYSEVNHHATAHKVLQ